MTGSFIEKSQLPECFAKKIQIADLPFQVDLIRKCSRNSSAVMRPDVTMNEMCPFLFSLSLSLSLSLSISLSFLPLTVTIPPIRAQKSNQTNQCRSELDALAVASLTLFSWPTCESWVREQSSPSGLTHHPSAVWTHSVTAPRFPSRQAHLISTTTFFHQRTSYRVVLRFQVRWRVGQSLQIEVVLPCSLLSRTPISEVLCRLVLWMLCYAATHLGMLGWAWESCLTMLNVGEETTLIQT